MKPALTLLASILVISWIAGDSAAQFPPPEDMLSGHTTANLVGAGQQTISLVAVPADAYFILTDFEIEVRNSEAGNCFVLILEATFEKWWAMIYAPANYIPVTRSMSLRTGLVFQPGTLVRFSLLNQTNAIQQNNINWSGYLVHVAQSSVEPGPPIGTGMDLRAIPNPSGELAHINFSLADRGPVTVAVFDVQGRRIRTLQQGILDNGTYSLPWDGKDDKGAEVPSGSYFARVETSTATRTGKLLRVR